MTKANLLLCGMASQIVCTKAALAQLPQSPCFHGDNAGMLWECCNRHYNPECWNDKFTYERCCLNITQPGDSTCWDGGVNFDTCCLGYLHWFTNYHCFTREFTFDRCCGGHIAVLWFMMKKRLKGAFGKVWLSLPRPCLRLLGLSLCFRVVAVFRAALLKGEETVPSSTRPRSLIVPAATSLRVMATCGLVAYHSSGYCGFARKCVDSWLAAPPFKQFLQSYFVIHTDLFFVLTAYIATVSAICTSKKGELPQIRTLAVRYASAILGRITRLLPAVIVAGSMLHPYVVSVFELLKNYRLGVFLGIHWPGRYPPTWPFGVEILCLAVLQGILAIITRAGELVGLSIAVVILAFCLNRRLQGGNGNYAQYPASFEAWESSHFAIGAHRLPLTLATLMFTCLLRHILGGTRESKNGDALHRSNGEELKSSSIDPVETVSGTCSSAADECTGNPGSPNSLPTEQRSSDAIVASDEIANRESPPTISKEELTPDVREVRNFLTRLGYSCYIDAFLDNGFDEMDIVQDMLEHHMALCGVLPGHMLKIQRGLKDSRLSGFTPKRNLWVCWRHIGSSRWFHYEVTNSVTRQPPKELSECVAMTSVLTDRALQADASTKPRIHLQHATSDRSLQAVVSADPRIHLRHAQYVASWILAIFGIFTSAGLEWLWYHGPRATILPFWFYPFPAKLPLLIGCVTLLEVSRRFAACGHIGTNGVMLWLERRSLAILFLSESLERFFAERLLPDHNIDLTMFFYHLLSLLCYCVAAASVHLFIEEPFRNALADLLATLRRLTQVDADCANGSIAAWIVTILLVLAACIVLAFAAKEACGEPFPSPCLL